MKQVLDTAQRDALLCCATGAHEQFAGIRRGYRNEVEALDAPNWIAAGSVEASSFYRQALISAVERCPE